MPDFLDRIQELEAQLAERNNQLRQALPAAESETHCLECDEPIPDARRKAQQGCELCIECQAQTEHPNHYR